MAPHGSGIRGEDPVIHSVAVKRCQVFGKSFSAALKRQRDLVVRRQAQCREQFDLHQPFRNKLPRKVCRVLGQQLHNTRNRRFSCHAAEAGDSSAEKISMGMRSADDIQTIVKQLEADRQ